MSSKSDDDEDLIDLNTDANKEQKEETKEDVDIKEEDVKFEAKEVGSENVDDGENVDDEVEAPIYPKFDDKDKKSEGGEKKTEKDEGAPAYPPMDDLPTPTKAAAVPVAKATELDPRPRNEPTETMHMLKSLRFNNREFAICLQNENGPCPLLCIINVLILRRRVQLPRSALELGAISSTELTQILGDFIVQANRVKPDDPQQELLAKTLSDVVEILPSLTKGLDVNVRFTSPEGFEFSSVISVFDMVGVRLMHGWIVDPNDKETAEALGNLTYNQVTNEIIAKDTAPETEQLRSFLKDTATQLTEFGLAELTKTVKEGELCALFRNNHFHAAFKRKGVLYLLITDIGYSQTMYAWEKLTKIDGSCDLVAFNFDKNIQSAVAAIANGTPTERTYDMDNIDPKVVESQRKLLAKIQNGSKSARQSRRNPRKNKSSRGKKGCIVF